ncbi:diguanylate cyclase domain-containing protein [Salinivibrio sp. ES.052]|uniref:diguanylate cyclase domain-containing protein n=1 Tax=Salinivibrio sp. ES.052 TaxID=1882823 RepID=UPI000929CB0C|nr:diguanylate cyclase [Salinivibrio sp. ES.052]SIO37952.1 diguanylate cyclase (GGDEF) domain-containing protein [Salinivibrio sp. ES.052]
MVLPRRIKTWFILFTLVYVVAAVSATALIGDTIVNRVIQEEQEDINRKASLIRSRIEAAIYHDTYVADSLATVVTIDPEFAMVNWDSVAQKLLDKADYVRNVGLAPDNIISHVYPLEGNQAAIGLDFRTRPDQYRTVLKARNLGDVYIAGPINLVQGGQAIIARFPIFSSPTESTDYWGGVSIVIDHIKMFAEVGLYDLVDANVAIKNSQTLDYFYGSQSTIADADFMVPISLPNGEWSLSVEYTLKQSPEIVRLGIMIYAISAGIFIVIYGLILLFYRSFLIAKKQALVDELTQLPNRRFAIEKLDSLTQEKKESFALLNIDLNDFKKVNDAYGHEAGDTLLSHVASALNKSTRSSDLVARMGGDEFIVALRDVHPNDVGKVVNSLQKTVEASACRWQRYHIYPSLSIGCALFNHQSPRDLDELMAAADQDMYRAKSSNQKQKPSINAIS